MNDLRTQTHLPPWVRRAIVMWWAILVLLWATLTLTRQLRGLLIQIVVALFFSFAMEPLVDWLSSRGMRRGIATALTMLTVAMFLIGFVVAMGSLVATQLRDLANNLPGYLTSAELWIEQRFNIEIESSDVVSQLQNGGQASEYLSGLADNLVGVGTSVVGVLFQLLAISLFAYYLTADGPRLRRVICSVLPPSRQYEVLRVWELAITKTGAFISSRVILAIISALFHWTVFAFLDLPSAVALALWVGIVSQFIPVIGIYIAGVVPALIALGINPSQALWVVIAMVIYQQIENYVLQPRVTAQTLNMHPAVAFAAVLAGTATFGASGALLALPFVATVQSFISVYIARHNVIENRLLGQPRQGRNHGVAPAPTDGDDSPEATDGDDSPEPAARGGTALDGNTDPDPKD